MDYLHLHRGIWRVRRVVPPPLVEKIGKATLTKTTGTDDYDRAVKIAKPIIREHDRVIARAAGRPAGRVNLKHVGPATSVEWYTPSFIFEAMPGVFFDLDPCSPGGQLTPWIPARRFLTIADDGLALPWHGFVWCNPPYGLRNGMQKWLEKFIAHGDGLLFTSANSYTKWWQNTAAHADAILHISGYVNAIDGRSMTRGTTASFGSCIFGIGERGVAALRLAEANGLGVLR